MRKRIKIDFNELIPAAWDLIWKAKRRLQKSENANGYGYSDHFYTTATDVERAVRVLIACDLKGEKRDINSYGGGVYGGVVRVSGNLFGAVRDWLLRNPNISRHNFGRGHISGMRFRPQGAPFSPQEKATMAVKRKREATPRPVHWYNPNGRHSKAACVPEPKNRRFSFRQPKRTAFCTSKKLEVTCVRCKSLDGFKAEAA